MEIQKLKTVVKSCAYPEPCQQYKKIKQINISIKY